MTIQIGILTQKINTYAQKRLLEASESMDCAIDFIQLSTCYMPISSLKPCVYTHDGRNLNHLHAVIPRFQSIDTFYGTAVLRQFESMGIFTLNSSLAITWTRNKLRTLQLLAKRKIPLPITGIADSPTETEKIIEMVGGTPLIIQIIERTEGKGTVFAGTHQAAVSVINAFKHIKANILVQEYFEECENTNIRCMVVGNQVIAAIQRTKTEENRSSIQFNAEPHLTPREIKIAIKATLALKLNFASVTIIRTNKGPLVVDVDCLPNIEMFETISQVDIVTPLLTFIANHLKSSQRS